MQYVSTCSKTGKTPSYAYTNNGQCSAFQPWHCWERALSSQMTTRHAKQIIAFTPQGIERIHRLRGLLNLGCLRLHYCCHMASVPRFSLSFDLLCLV